jgi:nucleotide-binding universal stress UspA family protein
VEVTGVRGSHGAVIVGVDGSQDATTGLAWALRHAQVAGLAVCVVHAWLPDEDEYGVSTGAPAVRYGQRIVRDRAMSEAAARERVHAAMAAAGTWVPIGRSLVTQRVVRGDPGAVLVELSRDGAQLVVGATGSGALPGILTPALGSTTRFVLRHAWCPVTVVPSARLRSGQAAPPAAADHGYGGGPAFPGLTGSGLTGPGLAGPEFTDPGFGAVPQARRPRAGS